MRQWFLRITAYADRLLENMEDLNWSDHIKEIQKNWIGKSQGSEIDFKIKKEQKKINELLYLKKGLMQNMFV